MPPTAAIAPRQVDHVRPGQDLPDRKAFGELGLGEPAESLDQFALCHREHASKAHQGEPGKGDEQIGRRARMWARCYAFNVVRHGGPAVPVIGQPKR
jgi:hypothetical protein